MPNRTIYLTKEQDAKFPEAQEAAKTLNTSIGALCAAALDAAITKAEQMKGNSHV